MISEQYIREVKINAPKELSDQYPYKLDAIRNTRLLKFHPKVTFLVGENGSGKSTLLEAIAVAYGLNPEGGTSNFNFHSRDTHSELCNHTILTKGIKRPRTSFFIRAESMYNLASHIEDINHDGGPPLVFSYGGKSLHNQSHGESFLSIVMNRFSENGLYILDEPESALSPKKQLTMLARMHQLIQGKSQFIIATHSPIIMAYPDSAIYEFSEQGIKKVNYEETEHFQITKTFLDKHQLIINELIK